MSTAATKPENGRQGMGPRDFLVVGYGNRLRGDDGVGPAVVELLRGLGLPGMRADSVHQLTPEHAAYVREAGAVVFVDAIHGDAVHDPDGTRVYGHARVSVRALVPPPEKMPGNGMAADWSGHRVSPESVLAWSAAFWGRFPEAWVVGIRADTYAWGESLSPGARSGVAAAVETILNLWQDWRARQGGMALAAALARPRELLERQGHA